ncbi:MAG: hypothetical protein B6U89_07310 [Desulfurococcales archaeon ex4484_58]|nr:MAG: hypothetical protein B6U89_07310 [Desulfurococcales archaeon ex4484_58]
MYRYKVIFDLLTTSFCDHPTLSGGLDMSTITKIVERISFRINEIIFLVSRTQYETYHRIYRKLFSDANIPPQYLLFTNRLLTEIKLIKNPRYRYKRKRWREYEDLDYAIREYFNECDVNDIFICLDKLYSEEQIRNTININVHFEKLSDNNAKPYHIYKV